MPKYLQKRDNTWYVVVEVPKKLKAELKRAGEKPRDRYVRSLRTSNLSVAERTKYPHVAEFMAEIEALKKDRDPKAEMYRHAAENARLLARLPDREDEEQGWEVNWKDFIRSQIGDEERKAVEETLGREDAVRFVKASTGVGTPIKDQIEPWIAECPDKGQTKSQHRSTVSRYLAWAGEFTSVQDTDRVKAGEYVTHLITASGLARRTIRRHLSSMSNLWQWLDSKGLVAKDINPWLGHKLGKKPKNKARLGLSDELILKILSGTYSTERYAQLLKDLVRLALLHGARLDELCAIRREDVTQREDGYWFKIGDGKTDSAVREIPVHPRAVSIVERRLATAQQFLFEGLKPGGPDDKRSWYVSKAYGRFRQQVGVSGRFQDFHALRNTFLELVEGAEVAESTAKLLVGHKRESMTYGHYSKGQRVNLRNAIEKVDYGALVMAAI